MFPFRLFPTRMFARRYFPDRATPWTLPPMLAPTGYIVVTIDGIRYAIPATPLDP